MKIIFYISALILMGYLLFLIDVGLPSKNNGYIIGSAKTQFSVLVKK